MRLKLLGIYLTYKVANKYLNNRKQVEVAERNKTWFLPPLLFCESLKSVKGNSEKKMVLPFNNIVLCDGKTNFY